MNQVLEALNSVNYPVMIGAFLFFFIFGYLMYGALFAAIGGAVDSESDTQQFMLPITVPLILSIVMLQFFIQDPAGPGCLLVLGYPADITCCNDDPYTVRSPLLAGCLIHGASGPNFYRHYLDGREDIPDRDPDVREESKLQGALEVAEILVSGKRDKEVAKSGLVK